MYINTEKSSRNLFYIYVVLLVLFAFEIFLFIESGYRRPPLSLFVLVGLLVFLSVKGPYIFEYDRTQDKLKLVNKSILFNFLKIFNRYVEIENKQLKGYLVENSVLRPRLKIQYEDTNGKPQEAVFYLWSLNKVQRKDVKASLGRMLMRAKNPDSLPFKNVEVY